MKKNTLKKKIKKNKSIKEKLKNNLNYLNINKQYYDMEGGVKDDYKDDFIEILKQLEFYNRKYEKQNFKAKIYREAIENIKNFNDKITSSQDIKDLPGIGKAITEKLDEFIKSNIVENLEKLKKNTEHKNIKIIK